MTPGISDQAWEPPVPLTRSVLPIFPVETLPGRLQRFVEQLAASTETPRDLGGVLGLACLAAANAKVAEVSPKAGHHEPLSLMVFVAMSPGERKSAVFRQVFAPLERRERDLQKAAKPGIAAAHRELEAIEEELARVKKRAKQMQAAEDIASLRSLESERAAFQMPTLPRLLADDATPETIPHLLAANAGRLCIASSEGGLVATLAGRYSRGVANIDAFLKGHAGETLRIDRRGAEPVIVHDATLTVALAVQPSVLFELVGNEEFRARGLVARFLVSVPSPRIGTRTYDAPPMSESVEREYHELLQRLLSSPVPLAPRRLGFAAEAHTVWRAFAVEVERQCTDDGELVALRDWVSKLPGAVARIAGLLHLAELAWESDAAEQPITFQTVERAISLGRYFLAHARSVYAQSDGGGKGDARYLLEWVSTRASFSVRDVQRSHKHRFPTAEAARVTVRVLAEHGYIRERPPPEHVRGRPPNEIYDVHPMLAADKTAKASESR